MCVLCEMRGVAAAGGREGGMEGGEVVVGGVSLPRDRRDAVCDG